jgi:hypothetical protein
MTTNEKVARSSPKSSLTSAKRKLIGYSRQQFYKIRHNYQTYGAEDLLGKLPGGKEAHQRLRR